MTRDQQSPEQRLLRIRDLASNKEEHLATIEAVRLLADPAAAEVVCQLYNDLAVLRFRAGDGHGVRAHKAGPGPRSREC